MSTLKVESIQHPSSSTPAISLDSNGAMTGSFPAPNRNLLYNGAMQVHQRGTSTTGITGGGYYTADRMRPTLVATGTWTETVENDAPTGSGFKKSWKILCTTAKTPLDSNSEFALRQRLEGQDLQRIRKGTSSAQQLTLSFWVKSNTTGSYIVELFDHNNNRTISFNYSINFSNTWEKKIITFPEDTTGEFTNNNQLGLSVIWWLAAGSERNSGTLSDLNKTWNDASSAGALRVSGQTNLAANTNNYWQITGVQLETGPVATEFEFEPYGVTLAKCQRYFTCYRATAGGNQGLGIAQAGSSSVAYLEYLMPENARAISTSITVSSGSHFGASNASFSGTNMFTTVSLSGVSSIRSSMIVFSGGSGLVTGDATSIRSQNADAYIFFNGMEL